MIGSLENKNDPDYIPEETISDIPGYTPRSTRSRSRNNNPPFQLNSHFAFFSDLSTVSKAIKSKNSEAWKKVMDEKMSSHEQNQTWTLVQLPPGRKSIKAKWVFKSKRNDDGDVVRYKARLVAKRCAQKHGIDYNETFSLVVRYTSIRFLIALHGYKIEQMDAITAFLQGENFFILTTMEHPKYIN